MRGGGCCYTQDTPGAYMMDTNSKSVYLQQIDAVYDQIDLLETEYKRNYFYMKKQIAEIIERGKYEADLSIVDVANHLGKTRQAVHRIILEAYGVRHEDKAVNAKMGHRNAQKVSENF